MIRKLKGWATVWTMLRGEIQRMNCHLGEALKLIEEGSATNNATIREHVKQFFSIAEELEREIAKREVKSLQKVKANELRAIQFQKEQVETFLGEFNEKIAAIETQTRSALEETVSLLNC
jgi:gas vesicle protein